MPIQTNRSLEVVQGLDHFLTDQPVEVILLHGPAGLIHFASHSAPSVFGANVKLAMGNIIDFVHENDQQRVRDLFTDAALHGNRVPPVTVRIRGDGGEARWVVLFTVAVKDGVGKVIELHTTLRDVTQQITLRERIVEHDTLSHMTNLLAQVGGWYAEIPSGKLYWSEELRRIYELDEEVDPFEFDEKLDLTDGRLLDFYSQHDLDRLKAAGLSVISSDTSVTIEMPMRTAKGNDRFVRIFLSASYDNGVPTRIYGATQDITEIKEREAELERLVRELTIQNDRMEEFGHLVAHQLRAPYTTIASLTGLLQESEDEEEKRTLQSALVDAVELMSQTLDQVGEAVRVHREVTPESEVLNIEDVLNAVRKQLEHSITDVGATFTTDTSAVPEIEYPRVYLESVLRHVISNALRFCQNGRPLEIQVRTLIDQGTPTIEIKDNGVGIDLHRHGNKLFRLGTTFHRHASGRGVGLFMVRTIVESLGGEVEVESTPLEGTTFRLHLHRYKAVQA